MKRILGLFVLVASFMMLMGVSAFAGEDNSYDEAVAIAEATNVTIEAMIDEALTEVADLNADFDAELSTVGNDEVAIADIEDARADAVDSIMNTLIDETNDLSAQSRAEIADLGYYAYCEWTEVYVNGVLYLIDPLVVPEP